MKNYHKIYLISLLALAMSGLAACSDDDDIPGKVEPSASGVFTDIRDGRTYRWVRYGNLEWMADNFAYNTGASTTSGIYLDAEDYEGNPSDTSNVFKYGRLYSLQGALDACPDGWRLPTDEDWQNLEIILGMSRGEASSLEWRGNTAYSMLTMKGDTCALNLLLGGYFTTHTVAATPGWRFKGARAFYWTSTRDTTGGGGNYFFRELIYNRPQVYRQSTEPTEYKMSVRYVRNVE